MTLGTCTRVGLTAMVLCSFAGVREAPAQGLAYGIAGPAGVSGFFGSPGTALHAAGGGEALAAGRVGGAAELGILANASSALLVFSANGVVHLRDARRSRHSPFVSGGYTRMSSGEGSFDAWNVGVGIDIWSREHLGLRVEFRDHVRPDSRGTVQYWTIRDGVAVR